MAEAGLSSLFSLHDLSVMGVAEVLPKLPLLRRRWRETAAAARASAPVPRGGDRHTAKSRHGISVIRDPVAGTPSSTRAPNSSIG
jgi:hypothetical protein